MRRKWGKTSILLGSLIFGLSAGGEHRVNASEALLRANANAFQAIPGDYNGDGLVDIRDYGVWRQEFGATDCGEPADGNKDCLVDIIDYGIWRQNFGAKINTLTPTGTVVINPVGVNTNTPTATSTPTQTFTPSVTPTATRTPRPPTATPCPAPNPHCQ